MNDGPWGVADGTSPASAAVKRESIASSLIPTPGSSNERKPGSQDIHALSWDQGRVDRPPAEA